MGSCAYPARSRRPDTPYSPAWFPRLPATLFRMKSAVEIVRRYHLPGAKTGAPRLGGNWSELLLFEQGILETDSRETLRGRPPRPDPIQRPRRVWRLGVLSLARGRSSEAAFKLSKARGRPG